MVRDASHPPVGAVLRVVSAGTTLDDEGRTFPTVVIDVSEHLALAGVAHILATDGVGDLATSAALALDAEGRRSVVVTITATTPVATEFSIGFAMPGFARLLYEAADAGCLVVACAIGDPPEVLGNTWLGVDVDGRALSDVLTWAE